MHMMHMIAKDSAPVNAFVLTATRPAPSGLGRPRFFSNLGLVAATLLPVFSSSTGLPSGCWRDSNRKSSHLALEHRKSVDYCILLFNPFWNCRKDHFPGMPKNRSFDCRE